MEMDNLENFIRKNKESLDTHKPNKQVWEKIAAERADDTKVKSLAHGKKSNNIWKTMRIAASISILALAAFGGYKLLSLESSSSTPIANNTERSLPESVNELEQYYEQKVTGEFTKVTSLIADEKILLEVKEELELLDQEKSELIKEYDQSANTQEVVQALMNTYKMKLQVLENITTLLNENHDDKNTAL